ncbi:hypothetical protein LTR70_010442 [Exophiala xenobiotica]|uniref:Apple domain-containing protein n=1 Tax=Lithohypha guttulata TaxID=1690604 RepID=A0ABR0JU76_9EURO|nr:hypothetical protein LTR24_010435 [Lithohypha guttulata]KAK5309265.1 hypothetical protein LTR70_010442 [Exophiala xenobiotica]
MRLSRLTLVAASLVPFTDAFRYRQGGYRGSPADTSDTTGDTTADITADTTVTSLCPDASQGSTSNGYEIYCSLVIDPSDASNTILPADDNVATFEACLTLCDNTNDCTGLSYVEASTTCYLHKGDHKAASQRDGWNGARKVGSKVASTNSATSSSTRTDSSSTTSGNSQSSSTSSTTTNSSTATPSPTTSTTAKSGTPPPSKKAGILIGSCSFGVALVLLIIFFIRKRRNRKMWTVRYPIDPSGRKPANQQSRWSRLRAQLLAQKKGHNKMPGDAGGREREISPLGMSTNEPTMNPTASQTSLPPPVPPKPAPNLTPAPPPIEIGVRHSRHEMPGNSMYPAELDSVPLSPQSYPSHPSAESKNLPLPVQNSIEEMQQSGHGAVGPRPYSFEPEPDAARVRTMREI